MISFLCPTRKRPIGLTNTVKSLRATAKSEVEVLVYIDDDDHASVGAAQNLGIGYTVGPRIRLTHCWNELYKKSKGDIVMQGNDDVAFRTPGWDQMVEKAFEEVPDKILFVHGTDEGQHYNTFGAHGLVHRRWADALGYFIAPYFSSDFGDTWLNDLANELDRRRYLPFVVDHIHYIFGKAQMDETTKDRLKRHQEDKVEALYEGLLPQRMADVAKLRATMNGHPSCKRWQILILTQPSRREYLKRLLAILTPQISTYYRDVELLVRDFNSSYSLGDNRQAMREEATARYVNFIDDDDTVSEDYVSTILPLLDGVDYIGFNLQCYVDGYPLLLTRHSLRFPDWNADQQGSYRDITHLNPILRHLALMAPIEGYHGEDHRWADALRAQKVVCTEHYIERVMYNYYSRSNKDKDDFKYPGACESSALGSIVIRPNGKPVLERRVNLTPVMLTADGRSLLLPACPKCSSTAVTIVRCNQCGYQFAT